MKLPLKCILTNLVHSVLPAHDKYNINLSLPSDALTEYIPFI